MAPDPIGYFDYGQEPFVPGNFEKGTGGLRGPGGTAQNPTPFSLEALGFGNPQYRGFTGYSPRRQDFFGGGMGAALPGVQLSGQPGGMAGPESYTTTSSTGGGGGPGDPFGFNAALGRISGSVDRSSGAGSVGTPWWGVNQSGQFSGPQALMELIQKSGLSGLFDPTGSPDLRNLLRQNAMNDARSRIRDAVTGAEVYGYDDPYLRNYARINAEQAAGSDLYKNLTAADLQSAAANQDFLHQLALGYFGGPVSRKDQPQQKGAGVSVGLPGGFSFGF